MKRSVETHINAQNEKLMYVIVVSLELLGGMIDVDPVGFVEDFDVVCSVVEMTRVVVVGWWVVLVLGGIFVVESVGFEEELDGLFSVVDMTGESTSGIMDRDLVRKADKNR